MNVALSRHIRDGLEAEVGVPIARNLERIRVSEPGPGGRLNNTWYIALVVALVKAGREVGAPTVSRAPPVQAHYVAMRLDGSPHAFAEMLALQTPPMSNTDREFLEGHCNGNQFEDTPAVGDYYAAEAKRQGVDITGKVYMAPLASYPGDPSAWVGGRGDVERVARMKGMEVTGSVNVKAADLGPPPDDVTVADDLVANKVEQMLDANPDLARADQGELFHTAREAIKPHWGD